jgi:hypothetical protein
VNNNLCLHAFDHKYRMRKWITLFEGYESYPSHLRGQEIADYMISTDDYEHTEEDGEEDDYFRAQFVNATATLQHIPIEGLRFNNGWADPEAFDHYQALETRYPPVVVIGDFIYEGNHRTKVEIEKGMTHIWAYVVSGVELDHRDRLPPPALTEGRNVEQQVSESEIATLALKTFRTVFAKSPVHSTYTIRAAHPAFDKLQIRLVGPHEGKQKSADGWMENDPFAAFITLFFPVPHGVDKVQEYLASKRFEMVFRHEFQHFLDKIENRFDFRQSVDARHDEEGYYNSDIEYPAFFKEHAEPLLAVLRAAKAGEPVNGEKIDPDFRQFMLHQHARSKAFSVNKLNAKTKQRYLRDMATLHRAVCAVAGATAPFTPSKIARIMTWLSDKTGINL